MSEQLQFRGVRHDHVRTSMTMDAPSRRVWVAPCLELHSTLTSLTQSAASLLFLQASIQQCFDERGRPVTCP